MTAAVLARKVVLFLVAGYSLFLVDRVARSARASARAPGAETEEARRAGRRVVRGGIAGGAAALVAFLAYRALAGGPPVPPPAIPYAGMAHAAVVGVASGALIALLSRSWRG